MKLNDLTLKVLHKAKQSAKIGRKTMGLKQIARLLRNHLSMTARSGMKQHSRIEDFRGKSMKFLNCGIRPLGIYPVVDRAYKLTALYEAGVTTAQLRVKDMQGSELEAEIVEAIRISSEYNSRLFINDFWELAIKHQAYGVHLGQEDIQDADIKAIHRADLRLGISTHTRDEINIALAFEPSYVAIGPIYETNSKKMVYDPVGLEDLKRWSKRVDYPIVAIGGIHLGNMEEVLKVGAANGIAMIAGVLDESKEVSRLKTVMLVDKFHRLFSEACRSELVYAETA